MGLSKKNLTKTLKQNFYKKPRKAILAILILLCLLFYIFSQIGSSPATLSDFSINMAAGCLGSLITIFFIDQLINYEKTNKLRSVNELNHGTVLIIIRRTMIQIMIAFKHIKKDSVLDLLDNAEIEFRKFIKDKKTDKRIADLEKFTQKNGLFLKKTNKILSDGYKSMLKGLKEFQPYPNPEVEKEITQMFSSLGYSSVGYELIDIFYKKVPKKVSKKGMSEMRPGMKVLWRLFAQGLTNKGRGLENYFKKNFSLLLGLADKAKKEKLFIEI